MGEIEWAMWANEHAVVSACVTLIGGILGTAGMFRNWQFSASAILVAILVLLLEYARGKRKKGSNTERPFQIYLTRVINALGPVTKNYYSRFVIHLLLSIPCCFVLPTILGGICLIITSIIYLVAAIHGEHWAPIGLPTAADQAESKVASFRPPERPPPRLQVEEQGAPSSIEENKV